MKQASSSESRKPNSELDKRNKIISRLVSAEGQSPDKNIYLTCPDRKYLDILNLSLTLTTLFWWRRFLSLNTVVVLNPNHDMKPLADQKYTKRIIFGEWCPPADQQLATGAVFLVFFKKQWGKTYFCRLVWRTFKWNIKSSLLMKVNLHTRGLQSGIRQWKPCMLITL